MVEVLRRRPRQVKSLLCNHPMWTPTTVTAAVLCVVGATTAAAFFKEVTTPEPPLSLWTLYLIESRDTGSRIELATVTLEADGGRWKITYDGLKTKAGEPSAVARGTVFFDGSMKSSGTGSGEVRGTAYAYHGRCPPLRYSVEGELLDGERVIKLRGKAPNYGENDCQIKSETERLMELQRCDVSRCGRPAASEWPGGRGGGGRRR
jgi:hypothetical protein